MKTAEEMFEELGFEVKHNTDSRLIYENIYGWEVIFLKSYKEYLVKFFSATSLELHKAITKQMEELGWL